MKQDDPRRPRPHGAFGQNVVSAFQRQGLRPYQPRIAGDRDQHHHQDQRPGTRTNHGNHRQRKQDHRQRRQRVEDQHQHRIQPARAKACNHAEEQPNHPCHSGRQQRDGKRGARPPDQARQRIAAQLVGACPMGQIGGHELVWHVDFHRVIGGDPWRQQRHRHKPHHQHQPHQPHRVRHQRLERRPVSREGHHAPSGPVWRSAGPPPSPPAGKTPS